MSHKVSLACAGAFAAAAALAGISPALSHTIVGNRVFPATLDIDDPGVNDELGLPTISYIANPDNSNEWDFNGAFQKTIFYNLSFFIADTFSHNTNTALFTNPVTGVTTFGTLNGWKNLRTQLKYVPYQNAEHEFIVSVAFAQEWGHTGNLSLGVDRFTALTAKGFVGKGFGDVEADWLKPIAITGEVDYTWSTHPIDFTFDPTTGLTVSQTPTVLTYGATLQYSLLYMNSFVHEVPEFFRHLIPDFEVSFSTPVSNIGPSVPLAIPGTHETTGVYGPGLYYLGRIGPISFELGAVAQIPINGGTARHAGWSAILDFFLDDIFPDSLGKPLFGPPQPRPGGTFY
jgi:hypothetical protein